MFTGLVERQGEVAEIRDLPGGIRLLIRAGAVADDAQVGDSICVSGCCLTVVQVEGQILHFEAGEETLSRTTFGSLQPGHQVNLERSLRVGDRLGGHFVSGHVDGLGTLQLRQDDADWSTFWFQTPPALMSHLVSKGSIAVDGVSLTVVDVQEQRFSVALIPHTLSVTSLGGLQVGSPVHLETDILAKYVARQLQCTGDAPPGDATDTLWPVDSDS